MRYPKTAFILSAALGMTSAPVLAQTSGAHFKSAIASVDGNGALNVAFDETGMGNANGSVHIVMTADAQGVYACINGGNKHPQASNKTNVASPITVPGDFPVGNNGRVRASLSGGPPSHGAFTCPTGQDLELACVKYTNVVLRDDTNGVQTTPTGIFAATQFTVTGYCPIP